MSRRLGAAVVGLGVGAAHAEAYARLDECELIFVHDFDAGLASEVAARLAPAEAAASFEQILADPRIDVVSIASYDDAHFEQVRAALAAGKHVFVEKPLCRTLEELRALKAASARRPGLHLASNLVLRSAPLYRRLREQREAGELGRVYAFDGDYLYGRLDKITKGWRRDVPDYSVMLGGGIHLVDLMLWITGERPDRVTAVGNRIATEASAFRYHDYVAAVFSFPSGLVGRVTANFGSVHRHQHVVRIFGTSASFLYDDAGARMHRSRDPAVSPETVPLPPTPASKAQLIPTFVRQIVAREDAELATQHEFDVVSACVGADRALAEGGPAVIEYV